MFDIIEVEVFGLLPPSNQHNTTHPFHLKINYCSSSSMERADELSAAASIYALVAESPFEHRQARNDLLMQPHPHLSDASLSSAGASNYFPSP